MSKRVVRGWMLAVCCVAAVACGGDDGGPDIQFNDAGPGGIDGGGATCNPFSQQGCAQGEKCASVTVQDEPTRIVQTLCVPDGTAALGEACENGDPGPDTGFDNCVAFNECVFGECRPVCQQTGGTVAGSCEGAAVCQIFNNLFKDLATDDIGICIPQCNPATGITREGATVTVDYADQCGTLQCYMNLFAGIGVCAGSFEGGGTHNMPCGDSCSLNGCAPGNEPFMPGGTLAQWQEETVFFANTIFGLADVCIQFCDPEGETAATNDTDERGWTADPGTGSASNFQANCPTVNECRYVTGVYLNFDEPDFAPNNFGLCIPTTAQLGSCADHVLDDVEAYLTEQGAEPMPVPGTNNFVPGCSPGTAVIAKIEEIIAADNPALTGDQVKAKTREVAKRLSAKIGPLPAALPQ